MIWAIKKGKRIKAKPKEKAICPICKTELIAKCGEIKIWHWAHKSNKDCDKWYEPESEWHINWKNQFKKEYQEVIVGKHRADIKTPYVVVELQNSSISSKEIREREVFYKKIVWLLNGKKFAKNLILRNKGGYFTFRWKHPFKSWWVAQKPIYIDFYEIINNYKNQGLSEILSKKPILKIKKLYKNIPCAGWGYLIKNEDFLREVL